MDAYDYAGRLRTALAAHGRKVKRNGEVWQFLCHRHEDKNPSAWIGDHRWGCFACGFDESLDTLAEHLGVEKPSRGFTLEQYAERKGFTLSKLAGWGLRTERGKYGTDEVVIPFYDVDGTTVLRTKIRTAGKTFWGPGSGTYLYGLNSLAKSKPDVPVILCEGESDCHAAWHHGILAVGVPGANGFKPEWAKLLAGRTVYVWREPDDGGAKLVAAILALFPAARVLSHETAKDIADLAKAEGANFKTVMRAMMADAAPAANAPPRIHFALAAGEKLREVYRRKMAPVDAVGTPIPSWNGACRDDGGQVGLARGWHVTLGANTGSGKSLLALNLAVKAVRNGERVTFVSLEMSDAQLITRYLSMLSGELVSKLEKGRWFDEAAYVRAERVANELHEETGAGVFVNEIPISSLADIDAAIRYQHEVHGCRYVITDYLQLARVAGRSELLETVTEVSATIRGTARDLNVISVGLSQFNRETSRDRENPPTPQGLMGGSPLENDSDQVVLLDHSNYTRSSEHAAVTKLLLAKNRHGPLKEIDVAWDYTTLTITERMPLVVAPPNAGEAWEPEGDYSANTTFAESLR